MKRDKVFSSMIRLTVLLFFVCLHSLLASQNADQKERQLEDLYNQLDKVRREAEKTEIQSRAIKQNIREYQVFAREGANRLEELEASGQTLETLIGRYEQEIRTMDMQREALKDLVRQEFRMYTDLALDAADDPKNRLRRQMLAILIHQTDIEIGKNNLRRTDLVDIADTYLASYLETCQVMEGVREDQILYSKKVVTLGSQAVALDLKGSQYRETIRNLEKSARELEDLITRLRLTEPISIPPSEQKPMSRFNLPVTGDILRGFGTYRNEEHKLTFENHGIDIAVAPDAQVGAIADGVVIFAQWFQNSGKVVIIDHLNGYHSLYSHNASLLVSMGDKVKKNQIIATAGNIANPDESFMHFELRKNGKPIDPTGYMIP